METALNAIQGKIAPPTQTVFLTQKEVAEKLKVSTVSVWSWTKAGILKSYRIGNQVRYIESEVIEALTVKATGKKVKANG
ncbi:helix-turn-helix domain-containing protein [Fibrella arboris]|uniref:helix-turn-helix domain-containing protein n=1 Tax=Fibrella arboris TaxID=3242486 RepID=UPI003520C7C0